MKQYFLHFFICIGIAAFFSPAIAQNPQDSSVTNLATVVISASRLQQTARELGRNVTVISGRDIERYPVNSLDDLLRCIPSIEVQSRGSFGSQADITLRGSTFNQVLILLDGMRLTDPLTGHFNGYLPIAPAEIAQIEIIRGAGSALYGPDAVGGVINIVTKTFDTRTHTSDARVQVQRGEWNFWNINGGGFLAKNKLRVGGGVLSNRTGGQPLDAPSNRRNDVDLQTYSLSVGYAISPKIRVAARANFDRRDFNAQWFYTNSSADLSRETVNRNWWQGQLFVQHSARQTTEVQYVNSFSTDLFVFNPAFTPSNHKMWFSKGQLIHRLQFNEHLGLAVGGQIDSRKITSNDRGNHQTSHFGGFATLTGKYAGLTATGSLRYDNDEGFGSEITPQINLSYGLAKGIVLRGSVGKSIRAADFTERFVSNNLPGPLSAGRNIGLASLAAERATNYEIGADWYAQNGFTLKTTLFQRDGRNLIDYVSLVGSEVIRQTGLANLAADRNYRLAQNLFSVQTRGLEIELWWAKNFTKNSRMELGTGYTVLSTKNSTGVVSQYLANFARNQFTGTATLTSGRLSFTFSGLYKARNAAAVAAINRTLTPNYTVVNSRAEIAVLPKRLFITAQVHNLFDAQYADILGATMPRRWAMGGIRWQLK